MQGKFEAEVVVQVKFKLNIKIRSRDAHTTYDAYRMYGVGTREMYIVLSMDGNVVPSIQLAPGDGDREQKESIVNE